MAISQNFLTGRMRKSAGGTRFSTWRGLNVVASKPIEVRQNVTPAVELNRSKMSVIGKGISKLNIIVKDLYSLGIAKTTPFADTVRVFRAAMDDHLKLDAAKLSGTSFGTGNVATTGFVCMTPSAVNFELEPSQTDSIFGTEPFEVIVIVFNEKFDKIAVHKEIIYQPGSIFVPLVDFGFSVGDKVGFATKKVQYKPGADLSGKVKFFESLGFITLT